MIDYNGARTLRETPKIEVVKNIFFTVKIKWQQIMIN